LSLASMEERLLQEAASTRWRSYHDVTSDGATTSTTHHFFQDDDDDYWQWSSSNETETV
jgi:hypothetical protein